MGQPAICPLFAGILLLYNRKDGFYNKIKKYTKTKNKNINLLMQYAKQLKVKDKVMRYMEVLL